MPHIQIDYTASLEDVVTGERLVERIHQAAADSGIFPVWGIRTFARSVHQHCVGNGEKNNGFINITVRIAPGRNLALRQRIAKELLGPVLQSMDELFKTHRLGCQLEVIEFDANVVVYKNNLANSIDPDELVEFRAR